MISTPNRIQFGAEYHLKIPFHHKEFIPEEFKEMLQNHFSRTEIFGLWGNKRISLLHELDKQAILKLVKMDPLKIRNIIPRKFYELVYPYLWKRSRKISYHSYKSLIDSITTDDFHLEALSNNSDDISYWDIYAISHNSK
ncbi:hypothetical protein LCGC14_2770680 [marine sediment metagenome]|uniref:Uncharacterized protein n=1 Tax=marine sediment metagenome TaxID=412755 RepID=A0A0F8ZI20_9ZZZZ